MAGCISCVVLPLLLFLFHRFIQPVLLRFWNPWALKEDKREEGHNGYACPLNRSMAEREQIQEDQNSVDPGRLKND